MSPYQAYKLGNHLVAGLCLCVALAMVIFALIAITIGVLGPNAKASEIGMWFFLLTPLTGIPYVIRKFFIKPPQ